MTQTEEKPYDELWNTLGCGALPAGLAEFLYDTAKYCGLYNATHWLQLASGEESRDFTKLRQVGESDPERAEITSPRYEPSAEEIISGIEILWRRRLRSLEGWSRFGKVWTNNVNAAKARALRRLRDSEVKG